MHEIEEFYNNFNDSLIKDFIKGNPRTESAITRLSQFIPETSSNILDIGCGIGWSSYELSKYLPNSYVEGFDLSPVLINTAAKLFSNSNLSYKVVNVLEETFEGKYDIVFMVDVYEHIPFDKRSDFNKKLNLLLKNEGRVILACPSKFHQKWLKDNEPEGLQPVDENLDFSDMVKLADDINGEVIYFEYQKIWRSYDYFYSCIERKPEYNSSTGVKQSSSLKLEERELRIKRVNRVFGKSIVKKPSAFTNLFRALQNFVVR